MRRVLFVPMAALLFLGAGCASTAKPPQVTFTYPDAVETPAPKPTSTSPGILPQEQIADRQIRISTSKGDIVFELFADTAPKTVSNFVYLTSGGFYDGLKFHRREEGFVIQGGDPNGNGTGGSGYTIEEETKDNYSYDRGIVAMAKTSAPHSTGSQFFIMLDDKPLPKEYSIFGRVIDGMDVVDVIAVGDVMTKVIVEEVEP